MYDHNNPMSAMLILTAMRLSERSWEQTQPQEPNLLERILTRVRRIWDRQQIDAPTLPQEVAPPLPLQVSPRPALRDAA